MKPNIEEYITENIRELDLYEPNSGHEDRFEKLLQNSFNKSPESSEGSGEKNRKEKHRKKIPYTLAAFISAAAVIALILLIRGYTNGTDGCKLSGQVEEVANYYSMQLEMEADKIKKILASTDNADMQEVRNDVDAIINSSNEDIEEFCEIPEEQQIAFIKKRYDAYMSSLQRIGELTISNY